MARDFHNLTLKIQAEVKWVPGRSNISGNEEADATARARLLTLPPLQAQPSHTVLAYQRRLMYHSGKILVDDWWSKACQTRYRDLDLEMRRRKQPEIALPRNLLHHFLAARSGHRDLVAYHHQLNHEDTNLHCFYWQEISPIHFIGRRRNDHHIRTLRKGLTVATFTQ